MNVCVCLTPAILIQQNCLQKPPKYSLSCQHAFHSPTSLNAHPGWVARPFAEFRAEDFHLDRSGRGPGKGGEEDADEPLVP